MNRILFIHPNLNPLRRDGAFTRLIMFANSLHINKYDVYILVFVPVREWFGVILRLKRLDSRFNWFVLPSFSFYTFKYLAILNRYYASIFIAALVRINRFKIIQCELSTTLALTKLCPKTIRYISDFHADLYPELEFYGEKQWKIDLAKKESEYSLKNATYVLSVSRNLMTHLNTSYSSKFSAYIQPCLPDLGNFNVTYEMRQNKRVDLGLDKKVVLGYLGGLQSYQCIEQSVDLFCKLRTMGIDVFLCVFTCDEISDLEVLLSDKNIDSNSYMIECLKGTDVSMYTGILDFGLLLRENKTINLVSSPTKGLEYLASGNVLITTRYAGNMPDIVSDSSAGFILEDLSFSQNELDRLTEFIEFTMSRRELSFIESRNLVRFSHNWEDYFESIKHLYSV